MVYPNSMRTILDKLPSIHQNGKGYTALCPAHDDKERSLSVAEGDEGRVLLHCFAGCTLDQIVSSIGLKTSDLFVQKSKKVKGGTSVRSSNGATVQHLSCTLSEYATAKHLPEKFLRSLGLTDIPYMGSQVLRIPYATIDNTATPVRFRRALEGEKRFVWRKGDKPCLYGLDRLEKIRGENYVVLVEGESDCHTLWFRNIPALGIPGAANWRDDRDAQHLDGIETIYVVVEPDRGGKAVLEWLGKSSIVDRVRLVFLDEYKDPSGLHLDDPALFMERWNEALGRSTPWSDYAKECVESERKSAWEHCQELAECPDILNVFARDIRRAGVVGEERACKLVYLIIVTRLLDRIVSACIKGPSSAGKSFLLGKVLEFFPASAYYCLSAMSERALAYSEEPVSQRILVLYEAAGMRGDFASYLMRSLLSEGRIKYETVEKTSEGLKAKLIEREGPTGLLVTTTLANLHAENETRLFSIPVSDTQDQTSQVLIALANEDHGDEVDLEPWHALQTWLESGDNTVTIPFAQSLATLIPPVAVRLRRDFAAILLLIRAHAILHQTSRKRNDQGQIIADIEHDYASVRELVFDLVAEGVDATVSPTVRQTVNAVSQLVREYPDGVSVAVLGKVLRLDKGSASRRATVARNKGYLKNHESRKGHPARYVLGDSLPDNLNILPSVDLLRTKCCSVAAETHEAMVPPLDEPPPPEADCAKCGTRNWLWDESFAPPSWSCGSCKGEI